MAMKNFILSCFILLLSTQSVADIAIIANLQNSQHQLSALQVQDIFMGRTRSFPNGQFAITFDQQALRNDFYQKLTGRPIAQINAYWARLMFSGQTSPPTKLADDQSIIKVVQENAGAIGYIDSKNVDAQSVRILLILK
jgi:ABC-type phosphate transport system substrate-binding protein